MYHFTHTAPQNAWYIEMHNPHSLEEGHSEINQYMNQ